MAAAPSLGQDHLRDWSGRGGRKEAGLDQFRDKRGRTVGQGNYFRGPGGFQGDAGGRNEWA